MLFVCLRNFFRSHFVFSSEHIIWLSSLLFLRRSHSKLYRTHLIRIWLQSHHFPPFFTPDVVTIGSIEWAHVVANLVQFSHNMCELLLNLLILTFGILVLGFAIMISCLRKRGLYLNIVVRIFSSHLTYNLHWRLNLPPLFSSQWLTFCRNSSKTYFRPFLFRFSCSVWTDCLAWVESCFPSANWI